MRARAETARCSSRRTWCRTRRPPHTRRAGCESADQTPPERVPAGPAIGPLRRATRFEPPTRAAAAASVPRRPLRPRLALPELLYLSRRLGALVGRRSGERSLERCSRSRAARRASCGVRSGIARTMPAPAAGGSGSRAACAISIPRSRCRRNGTRRVPVRSGAASHAPVLSTVCASGVNAGCGSGPERAARGVRALSLSISLRDVL